MELNTQQYLRSGKTPEDLKKELGINFKRHTKYPNLISFKYNQIESPRNHPIVNECRGLILNEESNWDVVSFPFCRFFNAEEGHAAEIDWNTAVVQEKLDGSLLILYHYHGWEVTTSGSADAGGNVGLTTRTFREYFWDTARDTLPANWLEKAREDHCYMFELMGPDNRIVVYHPEAHLKLLGCRNLKTLQEIPVKEAIKHFYGVEPVREFQLSSVDEIISTFETLSPTSQEGYVVVDASFNRIKIKSPAYVAIHHAKDGLSTKAFVEIARTGEVWEMIAHFPEYEEPLNEAKQRFSSLVKRLEESYAKIADIENQKEFALANKCEVPGALFALRSGKVASIREFLCNMHIDKIMKLLDYKKRVVKHEEVTKEEIWE